MAKSSRGFESYESETLQDVHKNSNSFYLKKIRGAYDMAVFGIFQFLDGISVINWRYLVSKSPNGDGKIKLMIENTRGTVFIQKYDGYCRKEPRTPPSEIGKISLFFSRIFLKLGVHPQMPLTVNRKWYFIREGDDIRFFPI